jgi:hypothetical protein
VLPRVRINDREGRKRRHEKKAGELRAKDEKEKKNSNGERARRRELDRDGSARGEDGEMLR